MNIILRNVHKRNGFSASLLASTYTTAYHNIFVHVNVYNVYLWLVVISKSIFSFFIVANPHLSEVTLKGVDI